MVMKNPGAFVAIFGWTVHGDGKHVKQGEVVKTYERLTWPRTIGFGAQHVVAMFGSTFIFPIVMGLNPQLAVMMSGVATIIFLLIVKGRIPSYLGTSAAFVGGVAAVHAQGGTPQEVTGAIMVAGIVLALAGVFIHLVGAQFLTKVLPPVVVGGVVMLIGFNLAPVVARTYWPQDQWIALIVMLFTIVIAVVAKGFLGRMAVLLGLVFGYLLSWVFDRAFGQITSFSSSAGEATTHWRVDWSSVYAADWLGLPPMTDAAAGVVGFHLPVFNAAAIIVMLPGGDRPGGGERRTRQSGRGDDGGAAGQVRRAGGRRRRGGDRRRHHGRRFPDDDPCGEHRCDGRDQGLLHRRLLGGGRYRDPLRVLPEVRRAHLIGARRRAGRDHGRPVRHDRAAGAKIWIENKVDFARPVNMVPLAAGVIIAIGDVSLKFSETFTLSGITLGTIVVLVMYHLGRWLTDRSAGRAGAAADPGVRNVKRE